MNAGFNTHIPWWRVAAILGQPGASASKRLREEAGREGRLLDATFGRKTRALVVTDGNQVVLSAVHPETLMGRLEQARRAAQAEESRCR